MHSSDPQTPLKRSYPALRTAQACQLAHGSALAVCKYRHRPRLFLYHVSLRDTYRYMSRIAPTETGITLQLGTGNCRATPLSTRVSSLESCSWHTHARARAHTRTRTQTHTADDTVGGCGAGSRRGVPGSLSTPHKTHAAGMRSMQDPAVSRRSRRSSAQCQTRKDQRSGEKGACLTGRTTYSSPISHDWSEQHCGGTTERDDKRHKLSNHLDALSATRRLGAAWLACRLVLMLTEL